MKTVVTKLLIITLLGLAISDGLAAPTKVSPILEESYHTLRSARYFAWGPVGRVCMTSPSEKAFRTLAATGDGLPFFKALLQDGTREAKLYALCGIRHLAPDQFDTVAAPLITSSVGVSLEIGSHHIWQPIAQIVTQIRDGSYDDWFPPKKHSGR